VVVGEAEEGAEVMIEGERGHLEARWKDVGREGEDLGRLLMSLMLKWQIIGVALALVRVMVCREMRLLVVLRRVRAVLRLSRLVGAVLLLGMIWMMLI